MKDKDRLGPWAPRFWEGGASQQNGQNGREAFVWVDRVLATMGQVSLLEGSTREYNGKRTMKNGMGSNWKRTMKIGIQQW